MSTDAFAPKIKPEHVVAFGDAVFAFAITFMALSIDIPDFPPNLTESQLLTRLMICILKSRVILSVLLSLQFFGFHIIRFSIS